MLRKQIKRFTESLFWRVLKRNKPALFGFILILFFILLAVFSPLISPHDPLKQNLPNSLQGPSTGYPLGTDALGRCILSRIIYGARISLWIGMISVGIGAVIGVPVGLVSGYYSGKVDFVLQRLVDLLLSFPGILLSIIVVAILGVGLTNAMIAVGIAMIPSFARLVRGTALSIREAQYVEAAKALGVGDIIILFRHILLNSMGPLIVQITLMFGVSILFTAGLGFLGLGAQPPTPEWGAMLSGGRSYLVTSPHVATFPGIAIFFASLGFNLFGDALRQLIDPRLRTRL